MTGSLRYVMVGPQERQWPTRKPKAPARTPPESGSGARRSRRLSGPCSDLPLIVQEWLDIIASFDARFGLRASA
jgi:hypothetical protein